MKVLRTLKAKGGDGTESGATLEVFAEGGGLAVTECICEPPCGGEFAVAIQPARGFHVTHVKSTAYLRFVFDTAEEAVAGMKAVAKLVDWQATFEEALERARAVRDALSVAFTNAGGWDPRALDECEGFEPEDDQQDGRSWCANCGQPEKRHPEAKKKRRRARQKAATLH